MKTIIKYKTATIEVEVNDVEYKNNLDGDIVSKTKIANIEIVINNKIKGHKLQYNVNTNTYSIDYRDQIRLSKEAGDLIVEAIKDTNYKIIVFDPSKIKASKVDINICHKCSSYKIDCECN